MKSINLLIVISLISVCIIQLTSCSTTDSTGGLSGAYTYTGYDGNSTTIISGTLQLDVSDSLNVTGSWQFSAVTYAENIGPQIGTGELIGAFADGLLMVNLNPGWADNNVMLIGELSSGTYSGIWQYAGFAGVLNEGTFEARKN